MRLGRYERGDDVVSFCGVGSGVSNFEEDLVIPDELRRGERLADTIIVESQARLIPAISIVDEFSGSLGISTLSTESLFCGGVRFLRVDEEFIKGRWELDWWEEEIR